MSGNLAINDKGDALLFNGNAWAPAQIATNDQGERVAFDGNSWVSLEPPKPLGERLLNTAKDVGSDVADFAKRATEYRDTMFAKAMGGIAGLPRTTSDVINWGASKLGVSPDSIPFFGSIAGIGSHLPTGQQATDFMMKGLKADPRGFAERSINPVVDAGVQSMIGGPLFGAVGKMGPLINFAAGAGSEGAGEIAHEIAPEYETPARILGALAGGGGTAGAGAVANKTASIVKAAAKPFTAEGRDTLVGQVLNKAASNPQAAISALDSYQAGRTAFPDAVPGFGLSAAKASRDPGLMQLGEVAEAKNPALRSQYQTNNEAISSALDRVTAGSDPKVFIAELAKQDAGAAMRAQAALDALPPGADAASAGIAIQNALRGRYDSLVKARSDAADPLYTAARSSTTPVNPWGMMTSTADLAASTKGEPNNIVQGVRNLLFNKDGVPDRTAAGMMATRDAIGDMQGNPSLGNYSKSLLQNLKGKADEALSVVPEEQQARQVFAQHSAPLDPFSADLGNRNVADTIAKDRFGKDFLMEPDLVPGRFFKPGPAGAAAMRELFEARGNDPSVTNAMQGFIAEQARSAPNRRTFLRQYGPAIDAFNPAFRQQLDSAAATGNIVNGLRQSPSARFINGDLDAAVRSTLGAPDSARRLASIRLQVGNSPEAVAGMQRSIIDDFKRAATSSTQEDLQGNKMFLPAGASNWLTANREAVSKVLTPEQMNALDTIKRHLTDQAQTVPGRVGSPTYDRTATDSVLGAILSPKLAKLPLFHSVNKVLGLVYGGANEAAMNRLFDVIKDPVATRLLMAKATPGNVKLAEQTLPKLLGATAVSVNQPGERGAQ